MGQIFYIKMLIIKWFFNKKNFLDFVLQFIFKIKKHYLVSVA